MKPATFLTLIAPANCRATLRSAWWHFGLNLFVLLVCLGCACAVWNWLPLIAALWPLATTWYWSAVLVSRI